MMNEPQRFHLLVFMVLAADLNPDLDQATNLDEVVLVRFQNGFWFDAIPFSSAFNIDITKAAVYSAESLDSFTQKLLPYTFLGNKRTIITAPLSLNESGKVFKHDQDQLDNWLTPSNESTKKNLDLVFLFDGSESMTGAEFNQNKVFIREIMNNLKNTSIKFAAVQFSTTFRTVFDFNDYVNGTALKKLEQEEHMKGLTHMYKALRFTLSEILENQNAGASKDSNKAVLIITDGSPSDIDRNGIIIKSYEDKEIVRIAIGIRNVDLIKLKNIASEPKEKNIFKTNNYATLMELLETCQRRIFSMKGSQGVMVPISSGYPLSVGEKNGNHLYFTSAPHLNHASQVIVYQQDDNKWKMTQNITEDQIGSYFGAELCSVDIDSDNNTDFLLVGAPLFYLPEERREGMIYIYSLSDEMELRRELQVPAPSMGRFGTAIASLSDLNGDGLRDVAVGAPLEDNNTGAVYIYLGQRGTGMRNIFSLRITGADFHPGLKFFGQAITRNVDLGDDKLPNIVVGSQSAAVVLRYNNIGKSLHF